MSATYRVLLEGQHDLRRSVPARRDVFGHEAGRLGISQHGRSREAKVADLQIAIGVEQQIGWLSSQSSD